MSNNNDNKGLVDQAKEGFTAAKEHVQQGMETARDHIHEATKSKEQKQAEHPVETMKEKLPDSAGDAGQQIGNKIDEGMNKAQDFVEKKKEEYKQQE